MTQSLVTIAARIDPALLPVAQAAIDRLGNPAAPEVRARLDMLDDDGGGTHFISLHALPSFDAARAHLVLELTGDGDQRAAIGRVAKAIGHDLATVFALADDWNGYQVADYLRRHVVTTGVGIGQSAGLLHVGTPGVTVGRVRAEETLALRIDALLGAQPGGWSARQRIAAVRDALRDDPDALAPADAAPPFVPSSVFAVAARLFVSFVATYLWPVLALLALWMVASGLIRGGGVFDAPGSVAVFADGLWAGFKTGAPVALIGLIVAAIVLYTRLRRQEATDFVSERAPDRGMLHAIVARENFGAQNHMVSLTELKPGWLRGFTMRLALWAVGTVTPMRFAAGYLGPVGTIHFARFLVLPGTRDFIFFSNYGGSWEAYLEDFITLAHNGLTGAWSNTVGFPRTENLFLKGATDGERFKRYARQSMLPTRFWYTAYPQLTTDTIRANTAIRRGLSGAMTEDDATLWLGYFGSAIRPADRMVTNEIQSLVFGGLGFLPFGALTLWTLPHDVAKARTWLAEVAPFIAYGDGRRVRDDDRVSAICQLAVSAQGFERLGLPPRGLATFPDAFLDDMMHPARAKIIGDVGEDAPERWWWGQRSNDVALVVYGQNKRAFSTLVRKLDAIARAHGAQRVHRIDMKTYDKTKKDYNLEPFGFVDGASQPVIRGTYKGLRSGDPLHLVEPGEFVLGYPDNRGNLPPVPTLDALDDPDNALPLVEGGEQFARATVNVPRDLGCNGSFLVIRQIEQDRAAFDAYCGAEATRLKTRLQPPYRVDAEFIAAKLVGRWRNGSPLVRAAYSPSATPSIINANDFLLGEEDPEGLRCPFGAHIRRANPRDSLHPGSMDQVAIGNRHRILRIGRVYEPECGRNPGLLFMCLNGDIERQFEFVQQTWLHGNVISLTCPTALVNERDPLLGGGATQNRSFTIPSRDGPVKLSAPPRFMTVRGGGYFFLPGKRLIAYLSKAPG